MKIKEIFGNNRVVALAGEKSSGKTNNLMSLIRDFRKENKTAPIYVFGLNEVTLNWLKQFENVFEISSLDQLSDKHDSLIILDEVQRLKLNDRRYKDLLNDFIDFIYHKNNWVIFSSPNLREFNSVIGGRIERWALKSVRMDSLVNGSQLKDVLTNYSGRYKCIKDIRVPFDKLLVINNDCEKIIEIEYIKEIDNKTKNIDIFK